MRTLVLNAGYEPLAVVSFKRALVLVLNGAAPADVDLPRLGPEDRLVVLGENVGIPGGRNVGAGVADAGLLLFLDDDAELLGPTVLATAVQRFAADDRLGAMAIRLVDEDGRLLGSLTAREVLDLIEPSGRGTA